MSLLTPALARVPAAAIASTSRALSTSAVHLAKPPAQKNKKKTTLNIKKFKGDAGGGGGRIKAGGVALRSAIAQDAPDLGDLVKLYPESFVDANVGKPALFPSELTRTLQHFGLPHKLALEYGQGAPASVIRQETLDLRKQLETSKAGSSKDSRLILTGHRGSGKSVLLLQAVSCALESGWIVLYTPEARKWVDSSTGFAYDAESQTFVQAELSAQLLDKLLTVNRDRLATVKLPEAVKLGTHELEAGAKLSDLVTVGAKDDRVSVQALELVMSVLAKQTQYPVLVAIDDVQTLFQTSKYRQPDYTHLESYNLSVPRLFLQYFTGAASFAKGALIGAINNSYTPFLPTDDFLHGLGVETSHRVTPYSRLDEYHVAHAKSGIKVVPVPFGMSGAEAAGLFELWTRKGWTPNSSDDVFVNTLQGSQGNPRELIRGLTLTHTAWIA